MNEQTFTDGYCMNWISLTCQEDPQTIATRHANAEKRHGIPLRALVEVKETGERLYVCLHGRDDRDEMPTCALTTRPLLDIDKGWWVLNSASRHWYPEENLTVVRLPG